mgnify:CR=1 FL=1
MSAILLGLKCMCFWTWSSNVSLSRARKVFCAEGDTIVSEGTPSTGLYFIKTGQVTISRNFETLQVRSFLPRPCETGLHPTPCTS